jgi:hypothetical protein
MTGVQILIKGLQYAKVSHKFVMGSKTTVRTILMVSNQI